MGPDSHLCSSKEFRGHFVLPLHPPSTGSHPVPASRRCPAKRASGRAPGAASPSSFPSQQLAAEAEVFLPSPEELNFALSLGLRRLHTTQRSYLGKVERLQPPPCHPPASRGGAGGGPEPPPVHSLAL